ncbi:proline iminopeptidase-family hydrolase [Actinokineospora sp. PR83]|uniref:proline iminopeptidase-family hydrolase n=1 Tax=Actinokineospora sp. PR83 TaxID=2884908 RepID=UPI001F39F654|nr:proline iminopeptidase-family hydrolase [Actinokineospora sp. PR83]MCG8916283.1 proline iminopeptidase-family hydrolase [Actinokineospora sp. PR83]
MSTAETRTTAEGTLHRQGLRTWYRVVGTPAPGRAPVVVCHGGPGMTHDYLLSLAALDRVCVFYDQFGSGRSGRLPGAPEVFWRPELFLDELTALVSHLGFGSGYHVLGHSWGGMLALEHAVARPAGLLSVVAVGAFASARQYIDEVGGLVRNLPAEVRAAIEQHEAAGTTGSPDYKRAVRAFYREHVCRAKPVPDEVMATLVALGEDSAVYNAMMGPSEFSLTGSLRDWDIRPRLPRIVAPVLLASGRYDEVTPRAVAPLHDGIPGARWEVFENSSHMAHVEEPDRFRAVVDAFFSQHDPGSG